jgi:hypothetical protein
MNCIEKEVLNYSNERLSYDFFCKESKYDFDMTTIMEKVLGGSCLLTVRVKTNFNDSLPVTLSLTTNYSLNPIFGIREWSTKNGGWVYIINGYKHCTAKKAEWFKESDLYKSDEYLTYKHNVDLEREKIRTNHYLNLQKEMYDCIGPIGRKAINELPGIMGCATRERVRNWFVDNDFENIPPVEDFEKFRKSLSGWSVSSGQAYGHGCGTEMCIDYINKRFFTRGWSSDD